jgi:hypothetical protein
MLTAIEMKRDTLKSTVGLFLILAHFGAICLPFILAYWSFRLEEAGKIALVLAPVFSLYTVAIVKDIIKNQSARSSNKIVNLNFVFISFFFPVLFSIALYGIIIAYALSWIDDFDEMRNALSGVEIIFGVYLGFILDNLFKLPK